MKYVFMTTCVPEQPSRRWVEQLGVNPVRHRRAPSPRRPHRHHCRWTLRGKHARCVFVRFLSRLRRLVHAAVIFPVVLFMLLVGLDCSRRPAVVQPPGRSHGCRIWSVRGRDGPGRLDLLCAGISAVFPALPGFVSVRFNPSDPKFQPRRIVAPVHQHSAGNLPSCALTRLLPPPCSTATAQFTFPLVLYPHHPPPSRLFHLLTRH